MIYDASQGGGLKKKFTSNTGHQKKGCIWCKLLKNLRQQTEYRCISRHKNAQGQQAFHQLNHFICMWSSSHMTLVCQTTSTATSEVLLVSSANHKSKLLTRTAAQSAKGVWPKPASDVDLVLKRRAKSGRNLCLSPKWTEIPSSMERKKDEGDEKGERTVA